MLRISLAQLLPPGDPYQILFSLIYLLAFITLFMFFNQHFQRMWWTRDVEKAIVRLERYVKHSKEVLLKSVVDQGKPDFDPSKPIEDFLDFFVIEPVDRDPYGVLKRLEHILDVERSHFRSFVARVAPKADPVSAANLEDLIAVTMALNSIYKITKHYLILSKRTKSLLVLMQIAYAVPLIMRIAEAYYNSLDAFSTGKPIGDSAGPMVAGRFMLGYPCVRVAEDMVASQVPVDGRKLIVLKAEGPGGKVGKPGDAVVKVVEEHQNKVARIIMVDAAQKLEGERTGQVVEGVGAAIGDPGPEKYKIEEVATKYKIPLDAVVIKEAIEEAVSTMKKEIVDGVEAAVERVKEIIRTRTKDGDVVILAGIGNTIGIGNG
ncbi:MAG: DUF1512 domain-containing protein [Candidatus Nezhaarchaeota archaeon]|nr:DUF1512 domain-containing protein [Candidatus Nezhaarchaeota archaeon]